MSHFDHDRVMEILDGALQLPEPRRCWYLDSTCAGEPDLRREVEELLHYAPDAAAAFDTASDVVRRGGDDPDQIGSYDVLEPIGEGGMAVVYKAEQQRPVRRTVALKLIKLGMDTRQFVARFESERQALAMMDHPNVARVFDAGSTDTGRPYFVMEYVPGRPILDYCDEHAVDARRRLELFTAVCEAVEHAHRKGIIHRDIKNSNVLVTEVDGKPVPKVIDFGVAKAVQHSLTDRTLQTEQGQLIGTPEYMSPEQAERGAVDIDTRSDVYSLGVLLYELIAGVQPIPSDVLRNAGYEQVRQLIRDAVTPRPSTRLSKLSADDADRVARRRGTQAHTLIRELRAELEWIPLKAMRKDREQRYRSAAELADDVRNYLSGRPLIAGPESGWYRARKMVRRYRVPFASGAAAALALLLGTSVAVWQAVHATRAEQRAFREKQEAERSKDEATVVVKFLTDEVLARATPALLPDKSVRDAIVRVMLDPTAKTVSDRFANRPQVEARIQHILGVSYFALGKSDTGIVHARRAHDLHRVHLGAEHPFTLSSLGNVAAHLTRLGKYAEAEPLCREVLAGRRRVLGESDPETLASVDRLAALLQNQGRLAEAEPLCREALEGRRRLLGDSHPDTLESVHRMSELLHARGELAEARRLCREALDGRRRVLGEDHPLTLHSISQVARLLQDQGRLAEAEPLYRDALERRRRVLGEDHPDTLRGVSDMAYVLQAQGKLADAEPLCQEALKRSRLKLGEDHPNTISDINNLAFVLVRQGKLVEAEPLLREALQRNRVALGEDHPNTIACTSNLAYLLHRQGKLAEAEPLFREALARRRRVQGDDHPGTFGDIANLGSLLSDRGKQAEAEPLFAELYQRVQASQVEPRQAAIYIAQYGPCLARLRRFRDAEPPLRDAYQRLTSAGLTTHQHTARVLAALADVCDETGRPDEAAEWRGKLTALHAATRPATNPA